VHRSARHRDDPCAAREEAVATRAPLDTAKVMADNPVMLRLSG